ncbi:beta family protein [Allokutzneria albata]|uniref:beta family protein n=1 Tax=Allokutzneria albata TaxID=211114 RepID=UPI0004C3B10E|nr:hypothetical protein [Allokutzneria albata]
MVCLRSKQGELEALRHLGDASAQPTIMIELLDSVMPKDSGLLADLVRTTALLASLDHAPWIDVHRLTESNFLRQSPGGPFEFLEKLVEHELEDYGLAGLDKVALVPVVPIAAREDDLRTLRLLQENQQRDVVVRLPLTDLPASALADRVRRVAQHSGVERGRLHAVIDMGYVESVQPMKVTLAARMKVITESLLGPGATTLLAGSIPSARSGYATTVQNRPELPMWRAVNETSNESAIRYGDYGVAHPVPPLAGGRSRSPNPYLYYTVPGRTVFLRRHVPQEDREGEPRRRTVRHGLRRSRRGTGEPSRLRRE